MSNLNIFHTSTIMHNLRALKLNGTGGFHLPSLCVHHVIITKCEKTKCLASNGKTFIPNLVKMVSWFRSWKGHIQRG